MKRIGCVGDNCVDHYRQTGEDHFGGNPVNVAVYTRRLGDGISYVGAVGTDGRGAALLDALRGRGVDVRRDLCGAYQRRPRFRGLR